MEALNLHILDQLNTIDPQAWNACVDKDNPFSRYEFLHALESSGSVTSENGWHPQYFIITDENDKIWGCCAAYLKSHSYGEYVFDWAWADAYERAGGHYYPKLQCAIPFTPVTGNRLLIHPEADADLQKMLLSALVKRAKDLQISSLHLTFPSQKEWLLSKETGLLTRTGHQYHWTNQDYDSFDSFLEALTSRKRKNLRKERAAVQKSGIIFDVLSGDEIAPHHWDLFYQFYLDTSGRKWGHAYLNKAFFKQIGEAMAESIVLVLAKNPEGDVVAGALNIKGSETLYGRYWGCLEDYKFLHFETCYYQAIDYAIAHNLKRVEAGAQGHHKIQRGYLPVETYSAHWIADKGFQRAVQDFLVHDKKVNAQEIEQLSTLSPYKERPADPFS